MIGAWKSKPSFWKKMCSLAGTCLHDSMGFFNGIPWDSMEWDKYPYVFSIIIYIEILFGKTQSWMMYIWCGIHLAYIIVSLYHCIILYLSLGENVEKYDRKKKRNRPQNSPASPLSPWWIHSSLGEITSFLSFTLKSWSDIHIYYILYIYYKLCMHI